MRHEQIIQFRTCTTYQCCAGIDEGAQFHGDGSRSPGGAVYHLQESGIPVCTQGTEHGQRGPGAGPEDSFHYQVVAGFNSKAPSIRKLYRQKFERNRYSSSGGLSPWHSRTRVRAGNLRPEESNWSTVPTVCRRRKSSKFISFLYLTRVGRRVAAPIAARNQRGA